MTCLFSTDFIYFSIFQHLKIIPKCPNPHCSYRSQSSSKTCSCDPHLRTSANIRSMLHLMPSLAACRVPRCQAQSQGAQGEGQGCEGQGCAGRPEAWSHRRLGRSRPDCGVQKATLTVGGAGGRRGVEEARGRGSAKGGGIQVWGLSMGDRWG